MLANSLDNMSERIDKYLVDKKMVKTRSQAAMLIRQGDVLCNDLIVSKPGLKVCENDSIKIKQKEIYVSRGAYKLIKAIEEFNLNFENLILADCGASTGGFTQVCLLNKASRVYAIDVGHDQLAQELRDDKRVINLEGSNLKFPIDLPEQVDICVADLSFISLKLVYPNMAKILKPGGRAVLLIKPQFEAGRGRVGKNGLVDKKTREIVLNEVLDWFKDHGCIIEQFCESPIVGNKSGNIEYLVLVKGTFRSET